MSPKFFLSTLAAVLLAGSAEAQYTANFQTNIISGVTSNWVDDPSNPTAGYVVGSNTFFDTLIIQGGGVLSNGNGYIGYETSGSNNIAIVSDAGSAWSNQATLYVGYQGAGNQLIITNGGQVYSTNAFIGGAFASASNNAVIVSGSNSVWNIATDLVIGSNAANNTLVITNGGQVSDETALVGSDAGGNYNVSVLVTGTNSVWSNGPVLISVANAGGPANGGNAITVANGAQFISNGTVQIGNGAGTNTDIVLVTDPGTTWSNSLILQVSGSGSYNQFIVSNGATAYTGFSANIGGNPNTSNGVVVTGPGSVWTVPGNISIGQSGSGSFLIVTNGGFVQTIKIFVAYVGGSSGVLIIAGGTNEISSDLQVGFPVGFLGSTGTVTVASGALFVTNSTGTARTVVAGSGTLILGAGTFKTDNLTVTNGGVVEYVQAYQVDSGSVTVAGGTVQADSSYVVAPSANSTGNVSVASGQLVATNGVIGVGNDGTTTNGFGVGTMTVSNGTVLGSSILLGSSAGGQGQLTVQTDGLVSLVGTGAVLVANDLTVDGGDVEIVNGIIYCGESHPGAMTMNTGSANCQITYVGYDSQGTLTMVAGQMTVSSLLEIGFTSGSAGSVWISGGQLTATTLPTTIGNQGAGQMSISNGIVTMADVVVGNSSNPSTLTLTGGTLTVNTLVLPNPSSQFNFTGGWLNALGITNSNGQMLTLGNGVTATTLNLLGGISSLGNGLEIHNNATLTGCGTINGNVTVDSGGTVLANCGTLTFTGIVINNGTMRANGGSVMESYGPVVNNGTIDIINGTTNFHGGFVNNGTVLTASSVKISQVSQSVQGFVVQIPSVTGHTYQLLYTTSLTPATWTPTGASQSGNGGVLTFTDTGGAANPQRFYRVEVTAP